MTEAGRRREDERRVRELVLGRPPSGLCLLLMIQVTLISGCSLPDAGDQHIVQRSPVVGISRIERSDTSATVAVVAVWPNICGVFSHNVVERDGHSFSVEVFGEQHGGGACGTALKEFESVVTIVIDEPGLYLFCFWQTDSTSVDTIVAVGVFAVPTSERIDLTNGTDSTIYYDTYPLLCDACPLTPACVDPALCTQVVTDETAGLDPFGSGTAIRWWRLVPDIQGNGFRPDEVRYLICGEDSCR